MANQQLLQEINSEASKFLSMLASPPPPPKPPIPSVSRRARRLAKIHSPSSSLQNKFLSKRTPLISSPPPSSTAIGPLQRSLSEPLNFSPTPVTKNAAAETPPPKSAASLPPLPRRRTTSVGCNEESPSSKRLKRMKERMEQMSHWCHQVISESDEDQEQEDDPDSAATATQSTAQEKEEEQEENEDRSEEESVWVEDKPGGGGFVIHFNCPCGKAYEILLSQNKCYYKLM